jgi:hypothetical protein
MGGHRAGIGENYMMVEAPRERKCGLCQHYGFNIGNPRGWRWAYCFYKEKWFPESIIKPGERQGCENWK